MCSKEMDRDYGKEFKALRRRMGLSQSKFAEHFHIPLASLQSWERNRHSPPDYVLYLVKRVAEMENFYE